MQRVLKFLKKILNKEPKIMDQLDYDLDMHYDSIEKSNDCATCGAPINEDKDYCSKSCYRADQ